VVLDPADGGAHRVFAVGGEALLHLRVLDQCMADDVTTGIDRRKTCSVGIDRKRP